MRLVEPGPCANGFDCGAGPRSAASSASLSSPCPSQSPPPPRDRRGHFGFLAARGGVAAFLPAKKGDGAVDDPRGDYLIGDRLPPQRPPAWSATAVHREACDLAIVAAFVCPTPLAAPHPHAPCRLHLYPISALLFSQMAWSLRAGPNLCVFYESPTSTQQAGWRATCWLRARPRCSTGPSLSFPSPLSMLDPIRGRLIHRPAIM